MMDMFYIVIAIMIMITAYINWTSIRPPKA